MAQIKIEVSGQSLLITQSAVLPSGGYNADSVLFEFKDATWNDYTLAGAFYRKGAQHGFHRIFNKGFECLIPNEIIREGGPIYIGLLGMSPDRQVIRSSELVRFVVKDGAISEIAQAWSPTPDTFTQVMQFFGGLEGSEAALAKAEEVLGKANKALQDASAANNAVEDVQRKHGEVVDMHTAVTDAKNILVGADGTGGAKKEMLDAKNDFDPKYANFVTENNDFDTKYPEVVSKHEEVVSKASDVKTAHDVIVGVDGLGGAKKDVLEAQAIVNRDKGDIANMKAEVERIYQDASEGGIYGVDFNMQTGTAVRLGAAKNLVFRKFVGNGASAQLKSDFETIGPWGSVYQTLRTVDGNKLVARSGDASFEADLRSGEYNVFTHIPRYYVSTTSPMLDGAPHWIINVSTKPFKDAICLFDREAIELGSCVTSLENGKHVSKPNLVPLVNTTGTTFETKAKAQGLYVSGWRDFLIWWLLMLVETANLNSQEGVAYGVGSTLKSWGGADLKIVEARSNSNEVVMGKWSTYTPGMTVHIGSASSSWYSGNIAVRRIVKVDTHPSNGEWVVLTIDGDPITTAVGDWCSGCGQITSDDALVAMGTKCGEYRYTETSSSWTHHAFVYGISDPWGNVFQFTEGYAKYNNKVYLSKGRENYPSSFPAEGWDEAADFPWISEGYPSAWEIKQARNNISLVPTAMGGSSGRLFGDYLWGAADGVRVPWRGGRFDSYANGGAVCLDMGAVGYATIIYGSRLLYLPE